MRLRASTSLLRWAVILWCLASTEEVLMRPKTPEPRADELFRSRLDNMIDLQHPLVRLAKLIDWSRFDRAFGDFYAEKGRPGLPTRLMAGIHLLKHMHGLSDEEVCARWVENP